MKRRLIIDYLGITIGSLLTAVGLAIFLVPNRIAAGGVSGIAIVLHFLLGFPVGLTMLLINIPLFFLGIREMGIPFGVRSLYGTVALSLFTDLLRPLTGPLTTNPLLASVYGGGLAGLGLGIVFRLRATTGGTDLAARVIHRYLNISVGQALLVIDSLVITAAGIAFNAELALWALIGLIVTTQMIDLVQEGEGHAKVAFIVSPHSERIAEGVFRKLDRGATGLKARGMYTGKEQEIVFSVVTRSEQTQLRDLVYEVDPEAFVVFADAHEVLGEGFQPRGGKPPGNRRQFLLRLRRRTRQSP
jgi:uncharacterized membrane-anchored protein YitT (DUF2179 family)